MPMAALTAPLDATLPCDVIARDGQCVHLRAIVKGDSAALREAILSASKETLRLRFHANAWPITDAALQYLTDVDGHEHIAIVATLPTPDLKGERGVGVARCVRIAPGSRIAEPAMVVADDARNIGIGAMLAAKLGSVAVAQGITTFRAYVLKGNEQVEHMLANAGAEQVEDDGEASTYDVALRPPRETLFASVVRLWSRI
jgi:GNAT superfamily N-acetyltransferase